jgi:hypothetical protein
VLLVETAEIEPKDMGDLSRDPTVATFAPKLPIRLDLALIVGANHGPGCLSGADWPRSRTTGRPMLASHVGTMA